jgi:hypothetical protein
MRRCIRIVIKPQLSRQDQQRAVMMSKKWVSWLWSFRKGEDRSELADYQMSVVMDGFPKTAESDGFTRQ